MKDFICEMVFREGKLISYEEITPIDTGPPQMERQILHCTVCGKRIVTTGFRGGMSWFTCKKHLVTTMAIIPSDLSSTR